MLPRWDGFYDDQDESMKEYTLKKPAGYMYFPGEGKRIAYQEKPNMFMMFFYNLVYCARWIDYA